MDDPFVSSEDFPVRCHKIAFRNGLSGIFFDKGSVIAIRYETDILAVRLVCHRQISFFCQFADLWFLIITNRHECVGKLSLCQVIKSIGLVFCRCHRIADRITPIWQLFDPCIMTGCNIIRPNLKAPLQKCFPLDIAVAGDTWIRRLSIQIRIRKIIHDIFPKIVFKIHYIIRNSNLGRNSSGIIHCTQSTASAILFLDEFVFILPDLHRHTNHIITLLFQKQSCHR